MADKPVAIVTGGSRGIGKGIAMELAGLGCDVVISHFDFDDHGRPDECAAQAAKDEIQACGASCLSLRADVSLAEDRERLVSTVEKRFGRCDMLVNNAGVAPLKRTDLLEADVESYRRVMKINLEGPYFLTQRVARWMIEQIAENPGRKCRIVNTGSISAYTSSPGRGEYCISKAGIGMMTILYADRLAEYGIGVFELRPGIIATDMTTVVKDKYDKMIAEGLTPIRRWGTPQDVAKAVGPSPKAGWIFAPGK